MLRYNLLGTLRRTLPRLVASPKTPVTSHYIRRFASSPIAHEQPRNPDDRIKIDKPSLMLAFTCKKCGTRSSHIISKQSYQTGSVMVQCPGCLNRHLIADHLNIFHDGTINIEDILKAQGEELTSDVHDLAFDDIPEGLKKMLGKYAKDAPAEYAQEEDVAESPKLTGKKRSD